MNCQAAQYFVGIETICIYVHNGWCADSGILDNHYSTNLEHLAVKCRSFYRPRNFSVLIITFVYILSDENVNTALGYLHSAINKKQNNYLQSVHIIADDFNQVDLKAVLLKFEQHKISYEGRDILEKAYSNIKCGFKSTP